MHSRLRLWVAGLPVLFLLSFVEGQTEWEAVPSGTTNNLFSIWGASAQSVFVVGAGGTILHYDGAAWSSFATDSTLHLVSVWGDARENVLATGDGGVILHFNGTEWTEMESGMTNEGPTLDAIWGSASDDVFVAGDDNGTGVILHYDGSTWSQLESRTGQE